MVLNRDDAADARHAAAIADADWIYFSGGKPGYVVETLSGTAFWSAVVARHRAGAVLAGASAGAMMLGSHTFYFPDGLGGSPVPRRVAVREALGPLPRLVGAPPFDAVSPHPGRGRAHGWPPGHRRAGLAGDNAIRQRAGGG